MRRRWTWLAMLAIAVGLGIAPGPAYAYYARTGWGYVWANQASAAIGVSYTPSLQYQSNWYSSLVNTVTRWGAGYYIVRIAGGDAPEGAVLVTAYGTPADAPDRYCNVSDYSSAADSTIDVLLTVHCYRHDGSAIDSQFTLTYTISGTDALPGTGGYVFNDQPEATLGTPYWGDIYRQHNSAGGGNTITHWARGWYRVRMPNLGIGHPLGAVHVTAFSDTTIWCTNGDATINTDYSVSFDIFCRDHSGAAANTKFTATYATEGNVLLEATAQHPTAYVVARCPTEPCQGPSIQYSFDTNPSAASTMERFGPGRYIFHIPLDLSGGDVQVTAHTGAGTIAHRCTVGSWYWDQIVVYCFDAAGNPADSGLDVSFVR
jgi:hypothetical protein